MKIASKISFSFLLVSLVLTSVFLSIFYFIVKADLQNTIHNNLVAVASSRASNIDTYLYMLKVSVGQLSKNTMLEDFLKVKDEKSPRRDDIFKQAMKGLKITAAANPSIYEFLLIDKSGRVVASSNETSIGLDKSTDSYFLGGRAGPFVKDVYYSETYKIPLMSASVPLLDNWTGKFLGVLVAKVKLNDLNDIVMHRAGMGNSGEIYIINKYGYMVTPSLFKENVVLNQRVDTEDAGRSCLQKNRELELSKNRETRPSLNYRNAKVLGASVSIPKMKWTVIAEIDATEAFWPLVKIRRVFIAILFLVPFIAWLLGIFIANTMTKSLHKLQEGIRIIGNGNLDYTVGTDEADEIGQLSRAFDKMTRNLKITTTSIDKLNKEISERKEAESKAERWALELERKIEELKRTHNVLIQSEKLASLGTLVSEIAHEINNPLMIISGNAQLSLLMEPLDIEVKNNMKVIMEECQRARTIINRVLRFAKPSKGETKEVDINKSLESVVLITEKSFRLANIEIKRSYIKKPVFISIDEQHMHEVFMNILHNAKDAMPDGGAITITTSIEGDFFRIDFKDSGAGMPEEAKQKIFEPFFTTKEKGTGLGLSICYGIVKAHNGQIRFDSELGKGTTFTITLPLNK